MTRFPVIFGCFLFLLISVEFLCADNPPASHVDPGTKSQDPTEVTSGTVVMQERFNFQGDISGHVPDKGSYGWSVDYSPETTVIMADGSKAIGKTNGGKRGDGNALAQYPFSPQSNTLYALSVVFNFQGSSKEDRWVGFGFECDPKMWMLLRPQPTDGADGSACGVYPNADGNGTAVTAWGIAAASYPEPHATMTFNTKTNEVAYYLNAVLQKKAVVPAPGISFIYIDFFRTAGSISVKSVTLTSQPAP